MLILDDRQPPITIGNHTVQFENNFTSNSKVIAQGEAECNFDCYMYNYS